VKNRAFLKRFIRAWLTSRTVEEVARRMGPGVNAEEARLIAEALMEGGVSLPPQPPGLVLRDTLVLQSREDGEFQDRRGREAYRVGPGTPLEGPWECPRCGETRLAGFFVLPEGDTDAWFICVKCVRVID
jgi:hypothetical protein